MKRIVIFLVFVAALASCRSTKKIQNALYKKDTSVLVSLPSPVNEKRNDTLEFIKKTLTQVRANTIQYKTFTAKVNVDYRGGDGKNYNVNAFVRMYRDSAIWIMANAVLGIEAIRVLITKDSVKVLNKLDKSYMARSVDYLQDLTALPLDLKTVQDLIIGNPVFLDSNIVSYSMSNNSISMLSIGKFFKNLLTLSATDHALLHSKLDDAALGRNRTADLTYNEFDNKRGVLFPNKRRISVAEKNHLDIKLDFRQYDFNEEVSFPFSVPRNYSRD